jgi:large subunit ribosomal protein L10
VNVALREPRAEKVAVVEEVRSRLEASSAAILTEYRGLGVADLEELRRTLRAAGGDYKIYKNTLVRRAASESGYGVLEPLLEGPTAIAFVSDDVAAVAKVLRDFARTNPNLVVKGGLIGSSLIGANEAAALADLPSREVLLAQIAGMLAAPMQRFAGLLQAVPQKFAYALQALVGERAEAEGPAPVAEAAVTEAPAETAAETPAEVAEASVAEAPVAEAPVAEAEVADTPAPEAEAPAAEVAAAEETTEATEDAAPAADEN